MDILKALDRLEKFETATGRLYKRLSERFHEDNEASTVFFRLFIEEEMHANIVSYQRRLVMQNMKMLGNVELEDVELEELTKAMEKVDSFGTAGPGPSLEETLRFALELEGDAVECHYKTALSGAKPELLPFFRSLGSFDAMHLHEFARFARKRGFSIQVDDRYSLAGAGDQDDDLSTAPAAGEARADRQASEGTRDAVSPAVIEKVEYYYTWHKSLGYYKILNLGEHATDREVKEAYHAMVKEFHPDRYEGLPDELMQKLQAVFAYIVSAYRILSDPRLRGEYDRSSRKVRK